MYGLTGFLYAFKKIIVDTVLFIDYISTTRLCIAISEGSG